MEVIATHTLSILIFSRFLRQRMHRQGNENNKNNQQDEVQHKLPELLLVRLRKAAEKVFRTGKGSTCPAPRAA
jgi:hypothetical protein